MSVATGARLVAVLLVAAAAAVSITATQTSALRVVVIEGEESVNIMQQKSAVAPVVEVRDRNDQPVAGAVVRFAIRGGRATFNGSRTLSVTTNAAGRAVANGLTPTARGALQIGATASYQGQTAAVTILQTNVLTAAQAAEITSAAGAGTSGGSGGAATGGGSAGGGGGLSGTTIGVVGGVATGIVAGTQVLGGGSDRIEPIVPPTVTIEPPVFPILRPYVSQNVRFLSATPADGGTVPVSALSQFSVTVEILANQTGFFNVQGNANLRTDNEPACVYSTSGTVRASVVGERLIVTARGYRLDENVCTPPVTTTALFIFCNQGGMPICDPVSPGGTISLPHRITFVP